MLEDKPPALFPAKLSVGVIIPTYNRKSYITHAIASVLRQSRMPEQLTVVDDGSTDGTPDLLAEYGPPVRVIRQANRGRSAARNVGLNSTTTDAVIFLDSDDLMMPTCIERCAEVLERESDTGVVYTDGWVMDSNSNLRWRYSQAIGGCRPSGMVFGELAQQCFLTVTSMVRRSLLNDVNFEEGMEYCEDYDFWRRLAAQYRFQFVDEPLIAYRQHKEMTVASCQHDILEGEIKVRDRFLAMPEFNRLSMRAQARVYCVHGVRHAMCDRLDVAKYYFQKAVFACPTYVAGPALTMISFFGSDFLKSAIFKSRQMTGKKLGLRDDSLSGI